MPFKKGEIPPGAKPFQKGQVANPNGRPKTIPDLDKLLAEHLSDGNMEDVLKALIKEAKSGNIRAIEVLMNRGYGMPGQTIKQKHEIDPEAFKTWLEQFS